MSTNAINVAVNSFTRGNSKRLAESAAWPLPVKSAKTTAVHAKPNANLCGKEFFYYMVLADLCLKAKLLSDGVAKSSAKKSDIHSFK